MGEVGLPNIYPAPASVSEDDVALRDHFSAALGAPAAQRVAPDTIIGERQWMRASEGLG